MTTRTIPKAFTGRADVWCPVATRPGGYTRNGDGSPACHCLGERCALWVPVNAKTGRCGLSSAAQVKGVPVKKEVKEDDHEDD